MTPLLTAVASLALAIAIIAAFAVWLRHCLNRRVRRVAESAAADPALPDRETIQPDDAPRD
jgi:hypothetical protein